RTEATSKRVGGSSNARRVGEASAGSNRAAGRSPGDEGRLGTAPCCRRGAATRRGRPARRARSSARPARATIAPPALGDASVEDVVEGIARAAVHLDDVVEMGPRAAAGVADGGDLLAALHGLAGLHEDPARMSIDRLDPVAVVDDEGLAERTLVADEAGAAAGRGDDGRPDGGGDVEAGMHLP